MKEWENNLNNQIKRVDHALIKNRLINYSYMDILWLRNACDEVLELKKRNR